MMWIYGKIRDLLSVGSSLVVITVLDKQGSSSREEGTKMLVREDLTTEGSIGGGLLEAMAVMLAVEAFKNKGFVLKNTGPLIAAEYMGPEDKNDLRYFNEISKFIDDKKNLVAVTRFPRKGRIRREVLFEEDYFRLDRQRAGDTKPLLLSARKAQSALRQNVLHLVPDGRAPQSGLDPRIELATRELLIQADRERDIVVDRHWKRG